MGIPVTRSRRRRTTSSSIRCADGLKEFLKNKDLVAINVFNFLWDWFAVHIVKMDKKYAPFFKERKVG